MSKLAVSSPTLEPGNGLKSTMMVSFATGSLIMLVSASRAFPG